MYVSHAPKGALCDIFGCVRQLYILPRNILLRLLLRVHCRRDLRHEVSKVHRGWDSVKNTAQVDRMMTEPVRRAEIAVETRVVSDAKLIDFFMFLPNKPEFELAPHLTWRRSATNLMNENASV